ncbi:MULTISPECIES: hypothetical protein [Pseudonocardia]|uniref:hypothetical protein n=1 Tax=Pseudonocardia TaxID=1847 RepID=UPI000A28A48A|nr:MULTISPECIES: hypothetical protein [Pseudonocardia]
MHPRYEWEPEAHRRRPVWTYPDREDPRHALSARHDALRREITAELTHLVHADPARSEHRDGRGHRATGPAPDQG